MEHYKVIDNWDPIKFFYKKLNNKKSYIKIIINLFSNIFFLILKYLKTFT